MLFVVFMPIRIAS